MSEEMINAAKARVADVVAKINGGVGEDISYDEKFEEIKAQAEKLSSVTGEQPDWSAIAVTSEELLQEKSKDFRVACYLAACKGRKSVEGMLDAMVLLREMADQYWEEMHPPLRRARARSGMLQWMSDQVGPAGLELKLTAADHPKVLVVDAYSKEFDAKFREILGENYSGISGLRDAVRHWVATCPKPAAPKAEPAPGAAAAPGDGPAKPAPVAPTGGGIAGDIATLEEAQKALKPLGNLLKKIATQLRTAKPEDELAYRFNRMGAWIELNKTPPAPNQGKSLVPPPPPHARNALDTMLQSSDWLNLLNAAETQAGNHILWLDPHRLSATAMGALGALFVKAKDELLLQVAILLKRCPTLPTIAFNDGTPFADGATKMWIESEVLPVMSAGGGGGGGGAQAAGALAEPLKEAKELAVKGELGKALDKLRVASAGAPTPAEGFQGRLWMSQLCLGASQFTIARGLLEGLTVDIDKHHLAAWDPLLCAEVYSGLYQALRSLNDARRPKTPQAAGARPAVPPEDEAAEQAAFEMLCRLNPAEALKLSK